MSASFLRAVELRATDHSTPASRPPSSAGRFSPLTRQEVVEKLDSIPVFHLQNAQAKIFPVPNVDGELAVRWYSDVDEANSALVATQALNPDTPLQLGVTPLGTAFALSEGWQQTPSTYPLRLHASSRVAATLAKELGAEPDAGAFPLFGCTELQSSRVLPLFLSREDMQETWRATGRSADSFPSDCTVLDLRQLVYKKMLADASVNWRTVMLIASTSATAKAQECEAAAEEPPPLQSDADEPPPLV